MQDAREPVVLNADVMLRTWVFFKQSHQLLDVDRRLASFLTAVQRLDNLPRSQLIVWRGEFTNSLGTSMWVIGIPAHYNVRIHSLMRKHLRDYDDSGTYRRIDTGCSPFLLLDRSGLYVFDDSHAGLETSLVLADESFRARAAAYGFRRSAEGAPQQDREAVRDVINSLRRECGESAAHNWPTATKYIPQLLSLGGPAITWKRLIELCECLGIGVHEVPIQDYGRTVVRPHWRDLGEEYEVYHSTNILINADVSAGLKRAALAHEIGHYVNHFPLLQAICDIPIAVQERPDAEHQIAEALGPTWRSVYSGATERDADIFASYILLSHQAEMYAETVAKVIVSTTPVSAEAHLAHWLSVALDPKGPAIGWGQVPEMNSDSFLRHLRMTTQDYSPRWSLEERLTWALANRRRPEVQTIVKGEQMLVTNTVTTITKIVHGLKRPRQTTTKGLLFERVSIDELKSWFASGVELWDPLILNERDRQIPEGYIGIVPRPYETRHSIDMNWALWECPLESPTGSLREWLEYATRRKKDLMLFQLSPLELHLRTISNEIWR